MVAVGSVGNHLRAAFVIAPLDFWTGRDRYSWQGTVKDRAAATTLERGRAAAQRNSHLRGQLRVSLNQFTVSSSIERACQFAVYGSRLP